MKKFKRTILALALVVAMSLTGTACGGGQGGAEALKGVDVENGILYVGNTAGTTGALATIGAPFVDGMNAAFAAYNKAGGYTGKLADGTQAEGLKVVLKNYDDGGEAVRSATLMTQLVHDDEVFAIVGNLGAECVAANLDIIKDAKVPMVYAAAGNDILHNANATGSERYIFPVQPLNTTEGEVLVVRAFAAEDKGGLGATKVGVISNTNEASKSIVKGINNGAKELPDAMKNSIVYQEVSSADGYGTVVNYLKNQECDVIIVAVVDQYLDVLSQIEKNNYKGKILTTYNNATHTVFNKKMTVNESSFDVFDSEKWGNLFTNCKIYAQGWLDINANPVIYGLAEEEQNTALNIAYKAVWEQFFPGTVYPGTTGFSASYFKTAEHIYDYALTVYNKDALQLAHAYSLTTNSYALAGYIAGDLFTQALEALEASGKNLTRADFVSVMEKTEFQIAMANTISFTNGLRVGVQDFSLMEIYYNSEVAATATSATRYTLMSANDYIELING